MNNNIKFYTPKDVAELLKVHPESVRRWIREGKLKSIQLGGKYIRVSDEDLRAFIESQRQKEIIQPNG